MTITNKVSLKSVNAGNTPISDVPNAPAIGAVADAGDGTTATVAYTASTTGGAATTFTATSSPGGLTGTGSSPISVTGLAAGTAYTFTVTASNSTGSATSGSSSSLTLASVGKYESISTTTVGAGGASSISFTSIPNTYTHLQIRGIGRTADGSTGGNLATYIRFNSDSGNNYSFHQLWGNGTSASSSSGTTQNLIYTIYAGPRQNDLASTFSGQIIDILDYANTNKYKTVRTLGGHDMNNTTAQRVAITSGLWQSTSAITRIDVYLESTMAQYTQFALYGIKAS